MYHSYGIGTNVVNIHGKILYSENFANLMNDAQFTKNLPHNACKYIETTAKDLFTLTLLSHLPNAYKFVKKNMLITVCFWTLYVGKNGRVEFWQIAVDKANSEEYFDESDDCSTDPVPTDYSGFIRPLMRTGSPYGHSMTMIKVVYLSVPLLCVQINYCVLFSQCCSVSSIVNKFSMLKYLCIMVKSTF